jgi:uncharacterized membrane protein
MVSVGPCVTALDRIRRSFLTGVVLLTPLAVTAYVLQLLVGWSLPLIDPLVRGTRLTNYTANVPILPELIAVLGILATITLVGGLAQWSVGQRLFGTAGRIIYLVPLVNTIYGSVRQVANAMVEGSTRYERVVLVEYPRAGCFTIGLVTGSAPAAAKSGSEPFYTVFLPNSPNPTAGRLVILPESELEETDMSVRRGLRLVITTGMTGGEGPGSVALPDVEPE